MFDLGRERYAPPPRDGDQTGRVAWETDLNQVRAEVATFLKSLQQSPHDDCTHTQIQAWLRDLRRSLDFHVDIASNDRGCPWQQGRLGDGCAETLPERVMMI